MHFIHLKFFESLMNFFWTHCFHMKTIENIWIWFSIHVNVVLSGICFCVEISDCLYIIFVHINFQSFMTLPVPFNHFIDFIDVTSQVLCSPSYLKFILNSLEVYFFSKRFILPKDSLFFMNIIRSFSWSKYKHSKNDKLKFYWACEVFILIRLIRCVKHSWNFSVLKGV